MFISSLELRNILSFREPPPFELGPLNILIGANGSGKSNLIDCLGILQALSNNLSSYFNRRGGTDAWIWKGSRSRDSAEIGCRFHVEGEQLLYEMEFGPLERTLSVEKESLSSDTRRDHFLIRQGLSVRIGETAGDNAAISPSESIFAAYRNPSDPTPITRSGRALEDIRIYREFDTSVNSSTRTGVSSSAEKHPLRDNGGNLALVLQELDFQGPLRKVKEHLYRLSDRFEDIKFRAEGAFFQFYVEERGLGKMPAARLSDGTLKFLCLMSVLLDAEPPRLLCIEEPEAGLHPDAMFLVSDAIREASTRMQVVVTTHSDALVDRFSDEPEHVIVCERGQDESTRVRRLSRRKLKEWLKDYTLGDLWRRGELGGSQR